MIININTHTIKQQFNARIFVRDYNSSIEIKLKQIMKSKLAWQTREPCNELH